MDTEDLIRYSRSRLDHESAKRLLREKYETKMIFAYRGGLWRAEVELIAFLTCFEQEDMVIKDLYDTPIKVNRSELLDLAKERYAEQMNAWLLDYEQLVKRQ